MKTIVNSILMHNNVSQRYLFICSSHIFYHSTIFTCGKFKVCHVRVKKKITENI